MCVCAGAGAGARRVWLLSFPQTSAASWMPTCTAARRQHPSHNSDPLRTTHNPAYAGRASERAGLSSLSPAQRPAPTGHPAAHTGRTRRTHLEDVKMLIISPHAGTYFSPRNVTMSAGGRGTATRSIALADRSSRSSCSSSLQPLHPGTASSDAARETSMLDAWCGSAAPPWP